ncbi:hypothetical protein AAXB25_22880 [Paenibacillus lautus]|uniref:hypothetical protein n=1 Tax=Paenibacillus lautus TaxID=1401 RepID=UPI003D27312F
MRAFAGTGRIEQSMVKAMCLTDISPLSVTIASRSLIESAMFITRLSTGTT